MRHIVLLLDELRALDVGLVTLGEGLDTTTPAGRMAFGICASVASNDISNAKRGVQPRLRQFWPDASVPGPGRWIDAATLLARLRSAFKDESRSRVNGV